MKKGHIFFLNSRTLVLKISSEIKQGLGNTRYIQFKIWDGVYDPDTYKYVLKQGDSPSRVKIVGYAIKKIIPEGYNGNIAILQNATVAVRINMQPVKAINATNKIKIILWDGTTPPVIHHYEFKRGRPSEEKIMKYVSERLLQNDGKIKKNNPGENPQFKQLSFL